MKFCSYVIMAFVPLFILSCDSGDDDDDGSTSQNITLTVLRSGGTATLTWTSPGGETSVKVYRKEGSATAVEIADVAAGTQTHDDTTLENAVRYEYHVDALSGTDVIGTSNSVVAEYVILLSPNGGDTYTLGQSVPITWYSSSNTQDWVIEMTFGSNVTEKVVNSGASSGFTWLAGYGSDGSAQPNQVQRITEDDSNVIIRVTTYEGEGGPHMVDVSDAPFTVDVP